MNVPVGIMGYRGIDRRDRRIKTKFFWFGEAAYGITIKIECPHSPINWARSGKFCQVRIVTVAKDLTR